MKEVTCHPGRKHRARGLCTSCYEKQLRKEHPGRLAAYNKQRREKNPDWKRKSHLLGKYGITESEYQRLAEEQGGQCLLCGFTPTKRHLDVDHDHTTGEVRGLLCNPCNRALGRLGDSEQGLQRILSYVRGYSITPAYSEPL